jgi:hypothetical protein
MAKRTKSKTRRGRKPRALGDVVDKVNRRFGIDVERERVGAVELAARVVDLMREGCPMQQIAQRLNKEHAQQLGFSLNREDPYDLLRYAARTDRLRFAPTHSDLLRERLHGKLHGLIDAGRIHVVLSPVAQDVALDAAKVLLTLLRDRADHQRSDRAKGAVGPAKEKPEIHVGFAGGDSLRLVARQLADLLVQLLAEPAAPLSNTRIVFHAMVGGLNTDRPANPNAFATYLVDDRGPLKDMTSFVGLHAPAFVKPGEREQLAQLELVKEALEYRNRLDLIVTSAGRWKCGHSVVVKLLRKVGSPDVDSLKDCCTGDMLWSPIGPAGEIKLPGEHVPMTLMSLSDLEAAVGSGTRVLLVLGPCGACGEPKTEILQSLIQSRRRYFTDLVVDSTCAREVCREG